MAHLLPTVKMDFIPSDDEEDDNEDPVMDTPSITIEERILRDNDPDHGEYSLKDENIVPDIKKKSEGMDVNDIFNMPENISPINAQGTEATPNLTKRGKPRKKRPPMSEEHKAKLKVARDKALAVRRKNAAEKKELKDLQKEEKDLIKKNQIKKVNKLKKEIAVEEEEPPMPEPFKEPVKREASYPTSTITKKDLEEAQLEAIIKYETIRKQRKKEKQERMKHENEQKMVRETLMRAVAPQNNYKTNNPFGNCY
tara:strand:- start:3056 stop:3817 length:762 start_codon:yes stop_codon:yes gene_type:complete